MDVNHVSHTIEPVFDEHSRVLLLGTMPSPASRSTGFYYGHPQNRFWRVLAAIFDEPVPHSTEDKRDLLLRRHIALWDVISSCDIKGASDASIRNAQANDLSRILDAADIRAICTTGTKASQLYKTLCEKDYGISGIALPSTSPANARMSLDDLVAAYREALLPYLPDESPLVLDVNQVIALERSIADSGTSLLTLMNRAGRALAKSARDTFASRKKKLTDVSDSETDIPIHASVSNTSKEIPRVTILCGMGNNGGDGWVAAEELASAGRSVSVVTPCVADQLTAEPARSAALAACAALPKSAQIVVSPDKEKLQSILESTDIIIDAILGTGFSGSEVRAPFDAWIHAANAQREQGTLTIAADVPSGLSAQTGKAAQPCMKADLTVTMMTLKPGLITPYAFAFCGDVHVAPLAYLAPHLDRLGFNNARSMTSNQRPNAHVAPHPNTSSKTQSQKHVPHNEGIDEFFRAENEDDDGYDPYSDRTDAEPLFERNPWD